jgi:hypothetical protein
MRRRASSGNPLLTVFSTRSLAIPGQSAGRFVFRGSIRIVPQIDLTVFSI